jgi:putative two-component system response regulator
MSRRGIRHVPVVEGGLPVGMISAREVMAEQCDTDRAMRDLTIYALARLSESRDPETGHHLDRVRSYALELCRQMRRQRRHAAEITEDFMQLMYATSPLHDIGKVSIPDCVLLKPGRLDEAEFEVMKTHARVGAETLGLALTRFPGASFLRMAKAIAGYHHERFDGQGYPEGLRGADIPLSARIFAVADVYDALVSRRVYKDAFTHQIARSIVVQGGGTQFDPDVVRAFLRCDERFQEIRRQYDIAQAA